MEYIQLMIGILLILIFSWLLVKNLKRKGFMNALLRIDTIGGIIAGFYLIITSIGSLMGQVFFIYGAFQGFLQRKPRLTEVLTCNKGRNSYE